VALFAITFVITTVNTKRMPMTQANDRPSATLRKAPAIFASKPVF
jgi:hypothetical protein